MNYLKVSLAPKAVAELRDVSYLLSVRQKRRVTLSEVVLLGLSHVREIELDWTKENQ